MPLDRARRNVVLLAICQALAMTGASLIMTTTALIGQSLLVDKSLSTLPLGLQFVATTATTIPASMLMQRIGRRAGFMIGAVIAAIGAGVMALAILSSNFLLFVLGSVIVGIFYGFVIFFRFAAADTAPPEFQNKAISLVLAGGVVAAVLGPNLARFTRDLVEPVTFAGSYLVLIGIFVLCAFVMAFIDIPRPTRAERRAGGRPMGEILRQPVCWVAMLGGLTAYGVMSLVMTSTPLAMAACGHGFDDTALVIQWHVLGMYVPSFFTGQIINRLGVLKVMATGALLLLAAGLVNLTGVELLQFYSALFLLGVGWNFLFVGSTSLLTRAYAPAEKAKVQGLNDFLVYAAVATASLSSGALEHAFGWTTVNLGVLGPVALVLLATAWLGLRLRTSPA